jgi:DNA-directed RNA polymerase I subunit RPA1
VEGKSFFQYFDIPWSTFISPAYTFRKEGHTKIIEYDLSIREKNRLKRKRPDVMQLDHLTANIKTLNEDIEMGDSEDEEEDSEGEDVMSDAGGGKTQPPNLPKAANGKVKTKRGRNERVITPAECRAHLRRLFYNEAAMCALIFGRHGPFSPLSPDGGFSYASADMFFMDVLLVPPTRFRPPATLGDTMFEHPQNELLGSVVRTSYQLRELNNKLREASEKNENYDEGTRQKAASLLLSMLIQLQVDVNSFMDSNKNPQIVRQGKLPPAGVKQGLEKKEGLFRKHMMVCINLLFTRYHLINVTGKAG